MHILNVKINNSDNDFLKKYYESKNSPAYEGDSGVDLVFPNDISFDLDTVQFVDLGISCRMVRADNQQNSEPFMLVPRSSISKTPLGMANSVGIIDAGYRGPIIAAVRRFRDIRFDHDVHGKTDKYVVKQGERLFQIIAYDGAPIKIRVVSDLDPTDRGSNGFGSSNIRIERGSSGRT